VASKLAEPTQAIEFTWDYGKTWESVNIATKPFHVSNIITEPAATSQHFLVYGTESHKAMGEDEEDAETKDKGVVVYADFSKLHEPQC